MTTASDPKSIAGLVLVGLLQCFCAWASPMSQRCHTYSRAGQHKKAGECFEAIGRSLGEVKTSAKKQLKGQMFRNAAISFRQAASKATQEGVELRLRAIALLQEIRRKKLCETPHRCRMIRALQTLIRTQIGYTLIAVNTGHPKARISLRGSGVQKQGRGHTWQAVVPPGSYLVTVRYPGPHATTQALVVKKGKVKVLNFKAPKPATDRRPPPRRRADTPPPRRRADAPPPRRQVARSRPAAPAPKPIAWGPWIIAGGAALAVAGGVLLLAGKLNEAGIHSDIAALKATNQTKTPAHTDAFLARFDAADATLVAGWIGLGLGVATAATGVLVQLLSTPKAPPPTSFQPDLPIDQEPPP